MPKKGKKDINRAHKGRRLEYKAMRALEKQGYVCIRAAGSHGPFDVVALSPGRILLVQVKSNAGASKEELEFLKAFAIPKCCVSKELWAYSDYARLPEITPIF